MNKNITKIRNEGFLALVFILPKNTQTNHKLKISKIYPISFIL